MNNMNIIQICKCINEINAKKDKSFNDFFIDDIIHFLDIDSGTNLEVDFKKRLGPEYDILIKCKNKNDVNKWLNKITSYIVKSIDTEQILLDYFS